MDPPFFLKNSSSSETPPDAISGHNAQSSIQQPILPYRSALIPLETQGSSSEDFRSVIDDLTVENKKLKRKLKKYEKLYDAHLQQEKLFEIRVHGLPAQKKRELEETLRKFALSLEGNPSTTEVSSGYADSTPAALDQQPTASSHTSTRFADSAYVSNTASKEGSAQHSLSLPTQDRGTRKISKHATAASRNQDIQSYLHDIPSTLMPKQTVAMTEKSKRKLVVRRLEQIFAGKGAAVGGHQQPLQQQEVSQSAARDDRMAIEAAGQEAKAEGLREARIMPKGEEKSKPVQVVDHAKLVVTNTRTGKTSPEQRPTRPLDLDLHRAQVPRDNIQYIRHLGFSPADFDAEERIDDHGYIYLNVLTNMAQLHTLNVTTDFVKKSIAEYSDKLMLSRDGRKVRWKGGQDVTKTSSDGSPGEGSPSSTRDLERPSKKSSTHRGNSNSNSNSSPAKASRAGSSNKLAYVPLFFHKQDSADDDLTSDEHTTSWDSPQQEQLAGNSSGLTSSGIRTSSSKRKRGDNGPIIFYNKMKFCTDLSGDHNPVGTSNNPNVRYSTIITNPVGTAVTRPASSDFSYTGKGALSNAPPPTEEMEIDSESEADLDDSEEPLRFSPKTVSVTAHGRAEPAHPDFEVSGLGGVQPSDHFKIEVQSRRRSNVGQAMPNATHFSRNKLYPQRIREILGDRQTSEGSASPVIEEEVVSTNRHNLPASVLPEPAMLFTFSSHEDDSDEDMADDSGAESDISDFDDDADRAPSAAPQMLQFQSDGSEDDESEEESDDGSVDFLAGAREVDPQAVHEREREYDANMAERLAEDIPAGSSAATAGGGSGFNSPVSPNVGADGKSPGAKRRQSGGLAQSVKRARTGQVEGEGKAEATEAAKAS